MKNYEMKKYYSLFLTLTILFITNTNIFSQNNIVPDGVADVMENFMSKDTTNKRYMEMV